MYKRQTRDSVTGEIIEAKGPTAQNPTQPSTVTPKAGYKFDKWTDNAGKSFKDNAALREASYSVDQTFTAHFTERADLHYEIHYFYEDVNSVVTELSLIHIYSGHWCSAGDGACKGSRTGNRRDRRHFGGSQLPHKR